MYTAAPGAGRWVQQCKGVALLVLEAASHAFYVGVVNMSSRKSALAVQLYHELKYAAAAGPQFHVFETDTQTVGLSFAAAADATEFSLRVTRALRRAKRAPAAHSAGTMPAGTLGAPPAGTLGRPSTAPSPAITVAPTVRAA